MKRSAFNLLLLALNIVSLVLLTLVCINLGIINVDSICLGALSTKQAVLKLLKNEYIINILCTIITAVALYFLQVKYSKHKLKNDFRCNEIIEGIYTGIEETQKITDIVKPLTQELNKLEHLPYLEREKIKAEKFVDVYSKHKTEFDMSNLGLTYYNNDILIDSVSTVFFINLNFKLLNIVNNIKNRKPNLIQKYPNITALYETLNKEKDAKTVLSLGREIEHYLVDVKFMANYYLDLLNYLGYDPIPTKLLITIFNQKYPTAEDTLNFYKLPTSQQNKILKSVVKSAKKEYFKYKAKNFFK